MPTLIYQRSEGSWQIKCEADPELECGSDEALESDILFSQIQAFIHLFHKLGIENKNTKLGSRIQKIHWKTWNTFQKNGKKVFLNKTQFIENKRTI